MSKVTSADLPSSDSVPWLPSAYGLSTLRTCFVPSRLVTTDCTTCRYSGLRFLAPFWLWMRTLSLSLSGKCADTALSARPDSPMPYSSSVSVLVPTEPPMKTARITKASHPKIAFFLC